ncbi:hypothetical protein CALCODRAFT_483784 [Calocera cornea HHB12733]|uniref:Uncharacterized protein n=1 Tax=Calocera cornea HHB12733 TaxID=1353952 RepID=A0A165FEY4_9BASI|nr:hypothetical protein CALCODRAFT_483784 [Calocera cornea HHB12733]
MSEVLESEEEDLPTVETVANGRGAPEEFNPRVFRVDFSEAAGSGAPPTHYQYHRATSPPAGRPAGRPAYMPEHRIQGREVQHEYLTRNGGPAPAHGLPTSRERAFAFSLLILPFCTRDELSDTQCLCPLLTIPLALLPGNLAVDSILRCDQQSLPPLILVNPSPHMG